MLRSGAWVGSRSAARRRRARSSGLGGSERYVLASTPEPIGSVVERTIACPWPITTSVEPPPRSTIAHSRRTACREWAMVDLRSEEHTFELQSPDHLVSRLLLEKKTTT